MAAGKRTKGSKKAKGSEVNIYGLNGKVKGKVTLPPVFDTQFRPDIIRRAVVAAQANRRQRYHPSTTAGMRHAVSTWGKGRGVARVQRLSQGRTGAESPNNVGGRRAHPPKPEHRFEKKINKKERHVAMASALAASAREEMVRERGHKFKEGLTLPVVVENDFESLEKAKDILTALDAIGVAFDIRRAHDGIHIRAGRGKMRGRRFRRPRSMLIIASEGSQVLTTARNLAGVKTSTPSLLNTENLAPGGDPGRLLLISSKALSDLGGES